MNDLTDVGAGLLVLLVIGWFKYILLPILAVRFVCGILEQLEDVRHWPARLRAFWKTPPWPSNWH